MATLADELANKAVKARPVALGHGEGIDLLPAGGKLVDDGDVQITVDNQRQSSRDGRRGHDKDVRTVTLGDEVGALINAEAVLLVGNDEAETAVLNILGKKGVGADDKIDLAVFELSLDLTLLLCGHGSGELPEPHAEGGEKAAERIEMLLREYLRRRHKGA